MGGGKDGSIFRDLAVFRFTLIGHFWPYWMTQSNDGISKISGLNIGITVLTINPFDLMNLYGPWRPDPFTGARRQTHFQTLAHWYESSRFDPSVVPEVVEAALLMPSPKTVRKYSARHGNLWKADWQFVRTKVLMQGLQLLYLQNRNDPVWGFSVDDLVKVIADHGITDRLTAHVVEHFLTVRNAPRVLVIGAASAPSREVGKRINALHKRLGGYWVLTFWVGKHHSWEIHDWADSQRLGILTVGEPGQRLAREALDQIVSQSDMALVFEKRGGKTMDRVIRACKAAGIPTELAFWSDESNGNLPEVASPGSVRKAKGSGQKHITDDLFGGA